MILYILGTAAALAAAYLVLDIIWTESHKRSYYPISTKRAVFYSLFWVPIITAFAFLVASIVLLVPAGIVGTTDGDSTTDELQAISLSRDTEGSFFLGTGYIDGVLEYYYYAKNDDGSYRLETVMAENATIIESNSETPSVTEIDLVFTDWIYPSTGPLSGMRTWDHRYVITVPEGSVKPNINMDLPK